VRRLIWNKEYECLPRKKLEELQIERLKKIVKWVFERIPFYRSLYEKEGINPDKISSLSDLKHLPFTEKDDLRKAFPFGMFAVPLSEVVRVHASSGTTGQQTVVGYTRNDIETWSEVMARTMASCGTTSEDIVHNAYGYGLFTGGLGVHYGAEKIGATVIPMSGGNTKRQVLVMRDFGSTVLTCTPSYALYMSEVAEEMGIDFKALKLKSGAFGAEPWSESMRVEIEKKLNLEPFDIYGLSEIIGPGVSAECEAHEGLHLYEDHFLPEIIDPETLEPLPPGEKGELVITTLTKEATPVIRYRTRDITSLNYEPCSCGRTLVRMERVTGRTDDMLIIRGVNVFPSQVEQILMEIEGTEPHYQIVVDRKDSLDVMEVWVEVSDKIFSDEIKKLEVIEKRIKEEIQSQLGISVEVKLVEPKTIERSMGKAKRVIDKRKI
jgi:phenylacetate-CoA ligase